MLQFDVIDLGIQCYVAPPWTSLYNTAFKHREAADPIEARINSLFSSPSVLTAIITASEYIGLQHHCGTLTFSSTRSVFGGNYSEINHCCRISCFDSVLLSIKHR